MKSLWLKWFADKAWKPFPFQRECWAAWLKGQSGLVHAPTGLGKTYAVWGGPVMEWLEQHPCIEKWPTKAESIRVLWVTPLRALANDTAESLRAPLSDLGIPWTVEMRTGDTSAATRQKQLKRLPTALITTPESLSLLLSHADTREKFATLRCVIVDEWHELVGSKRGVQTELCLARLRQWAPDLRVWGLSATLGNLDQAMQVLVGTDFEAKQTTLIAASSRKKFELATILPPDVKCFPWSGHLGLKLLPLVLKEIEKCQTTLLFVNTRSQVETWFRAVQEARPDWGDQVALHHGSVDRKQREAVEVRLRLGTVKCVVCTGSLDLGVDFSPVEQVIQVGGPKGVARMLQRAGRSGHQPGATSRILCVPSHALELVEFAAVRDAISRNEIEARIPLHSPLDLLVQHLVTLALGGGFLEAEARAEICSTHAYRDLSDEDWQWCLDFITRGGKSLTAYPQFQRVHYEGDFFSVEKRDIARFHRMSIGTITSSSMMNVKLLNGGYLGSIEEIFIAKLKPGDGFAFAGFQLEFVRVRDMNAIVRKSKKKAFQMPQWMGGYMPLSSQLAHAVRLQLSAAKRGVFQSPEMHAAKPVLQVQSAWSEIPDTGEFLIESIELPDGVFYFLYPFAGRLAHEGLATLIAHRLGKLSPRSFALTMNDYGFSLATHTPLGLDEEGWRKVLSPTHLLEDILECLNSSELARRKFREIARIAGLVFQGYPGSQKSTRQVQASSGLFYEVFTKYDPDNRLLDQAQREVMEHQLEFGRLHEALTQAQSMKLISRQTQRLTPLSFPLWAMWVQGQVSTEKWSERLRRMSEQLDAAAQ
jgi:ATP-dependent helicase Lhr and Lhr-like helicase